MAKGPEITDEVRMLIARLHKEHPKWTNKMMRNEVLGIVHKKDPSLPKDWPSKFAIDRIMPGIRERAMRKKIEPDPRDKPWTIQSMVKYPIPAEALPSVLQVWFVMRDRGMVLTIREADWVARLYTAIKWPLKLGPYAMMLARSRQLAEAAGREDYYGTEFDNVLVFRAFTGHLVTREEAKKLHGFTEEQWHHIDEIWPTIRDLVKPLGAALPDRRDFGVFPHRRHDEADMDQKKEAANERKHKAKK